MFFVLIRRARSPERSPIQKSRKARIGPQRPRRSGERRLSLAHLPATIQRGLVRRPKIGVPSSPPVRFLQPRGRRFSGSSRQFLGRSEIETERSFSALCQGEDRPSGTPRINTMVHARVTVDGVRTMPSGNSSFGPVARRRALQKFSRTRPEGQRITGTHKRAPSRCTGRNSWLSHARGSGFLSGGDVHRPPGGTESKEGSPAADPGGHECYPSPDP